MNTKTDYYAEQLPEHIYWQDIAQAREYGQIDDRFYVSYSSFSRFPSKKVFIHFEENTLERCVLKAWRELARRKDEWQFAEVAEGEV